MKPPPSEHVIVVKNKNLRWEVALDGLTRPMIDLLFSRERAIAHAFDRAHELAFKPAGSAVRVVVEGPGGFETHVAAIAKTG